MILITLQTRFSGESVTECFVSFVLQAEFSDCVNNQIIVSKRKAAAVKPIALIVGLSGCKLRDITLFCKILKFRSMSN